MTKALNESDVINILVNNNFGELIQTPVGSAISVDSYEGFLYSYITGSRYLDNPRFGFTPRGHLLLFNRLLSTEVVRGIFDNGHLKNSPRLMSINPNRTFLLDNQKKYIVPVAYAKETEFTAVKEQMYQLLVSHQINPSNFIIQAINSSVKGHSLEPFMEYLCCKLFSNKGYITDNQITLTANTGTPDVGFFRFHNINFFRGLIFLELAMSFLRPENLNVIEQLLPSTHIVGEVKTSTFQMKSQLDKYLETGLFNSAYEVHPFKMKSSADYLGLINIDDNYHIQVKASPNVIPTNNVKFEQYNHWIQTIAKIYILLNLSNEQLHVFFNNHGLPAEQLELDVFLKSTSSFSLIQLANYVKNQLTGSF